MNQTTLIEAAKEALNIALLKKDVMHKVASDKNATKPAYFIIIAAGLLGMLGQLIFGVKVPFFGTIRPSIGAALGGAVMQIIGAVIGLYVVSFIAKSIFKGSAQHSEFFRVGAFGMIVMWLGILPQISIISAIWGLVLIFVILKTIHKLTTGGTIGTLIVAMIAGFIISLVLSPLYALLGMGGMGSYNGGGSALDKGFRGFEINVPGEDSASVKFSEGGMKVTGPDGEVMEINIPTNFNE